MLDFVRRLVERGDARPADDGAGHTPMELQVAAAALLVEAATMDGSFDEGERAHIRDLVRDRFALAEDDAAALVEAAHAETRRMPESYGFTRVVRDHFSHEECIRLIEMLWEVVYADGELHHHEANLLRRVTGLLYVTDRESGEARKRVLDRLQVSE